MKKKFIMLLVLSVLCFILLVGCNDSDAENNETVTTEVESEAVSEVVEEISEEEEKELVEVVHYDSYPELKKYTDTKNETLINVCDQNINDDIEEKTQTILYNGAHFTMLEEHYMTVEFAKDIVGVTTPYNYIYLYVNTDEFGFYGFLYVETTGVDIEVPLTITYEDGSEEKFVIYLTKEWQYENEAEGKLTNDYLDHNEKSEYFLVVPVETETVPALVEDIEFTEIVDNIQTVYCINYEELYAFQSTLDKASLAVFAFGIAPEKGVVLLYDGACYTIEEDFAINIISSKTISKVTSKNGNVQIVDYDIDEQGNHVWSVALYETGVDIKVELCIEYEDGTSEDVTVYLSKDWKYDYEY